MDQDEMPKDDLQESKRETSEKSLLPEKSAPHSPGEDRAEIDKAPADPGIPSDEQELVEVDKQRSFLSRLLRWTVVVMVIFSLGVGATWLARVVPLQIEMDELTEELEQTREQAQLDAAEVEALLPLVEENEELKSKLLTLERHIELLKIQGDVAAAHLALLAEDVVTAKAALAGTDTRLEMLMMSLDGEDGNTVEGMLTRLDLVLEELGEDSFAAIRDLEVLSSNLAALERSIFGN